MVQQARGSGEGAFLAGMQELSMILFEDREEKGDKADQMQNVSVQARRVTTGATPKPNSAKYKQATCVGACCMRLHTHDR